MVWRIGAGSARPVVSMTTRSSRGISPLWSMSRSSMSSPTRSSRVVQQTQPLPSKTVRSSTRRRRWWSSPTSPNSLTRTAVLAIDGAESALARRVVLPLPRKPVTTVTGRLVLPSMGLPAVRRGERRLSAQHLLQGRVQGIEGPARELRRGGPEGAEVLDDLRTPFAVAEHVLAPAPVIDAEAVVAQHLVGEDDPVGAVTAPVPLERDRVEAGHGSPLPVLDVPVGPVDPSDEILSAKHAHRRILLGGDPFRGRGLDAVHVDARVVVRLGPRVALDEVVGDLLHRRPADAVVAVDVIDQPFEHQQTLRPAAHIRVDGQAVRRVVHLPVDPVELVAPQLLDVVRVDEAVAVRRALDEHHRRQVVEVPVAPDLDEVYFLAAHERLHPLLGRLGVVDLGPRVAHPRVVRGEVAVLETVVVLVVVLEEKLVGRGGDLPPRRHVADRLPACHVLDQLQALLQYVPLLLRCHRHRVLVGVAVAPDLLPSVNDHLYLIRERLDGVPRDEPGRPEVVLLEELEQPRCTYLAREQASRDVVG